MIPTHWKKASLGSLGDWSGGGTPSKLNPAFWTNGTIPWVSPKDMKVFRIAGAEDSITADAVQGSATKLVPTGSVLLVVRSGILAHTLPVAVASVPVTLNQDMKAITPTSEVVPDFLAYYLVSSGSRILRECSKAGTTVASVEFSALKLHVAPLPPLDEQHRIVAAIETHFSRLDAAVASLTRAKANVKRARASVLKAAVEGRLVPTEAALARAEGRAYEPASALLDRILAERKAAWAASGARGKYQEPVNPESERLPALPEGWCWATAAQCADSQAGNAFKSGDFQSEGVNLLRGDNIGHGRLRWGDRRRCIAETVELDFPHLTMSANDIVLAMDRPVISTGLKIARVHAADLPALLVQRVLRLRPAIHDGYFFHNLLSPAFIKHLETEAKGGGVPHVSEGQVGGFRLPLPPLAEQHRIASEVDRRLSVLDALDTTLDANLARCARLRQSILKRAFEGRLVPADMAPQLTPEALAATHASGART